MASSIRRIGNSRGVILPKPALAALGVAEGGAVEFVYEPGKITILPAGEDPREGWEQDSRRLGALGLTAEDIEWLEAPLGDDSGWEWDGKW